MQQAILARDAAYDLLDAAEAELLQTNGLNELREPKAAAFDPIGQPECLVVDAKTVRAAKGDGSEHRLDAHFHNPIAQLAIASIKTSRSEVKAVADVTEQVLMGPRFKRNYVEATHGVPFLSGKNIVQSRPNLKYLSKIQMADMQELLVKRSWTLVTCSGTIGRTCFVWKNYEDYAVSQHILRVIPDESEIDPGYLYAFLSCRYGYEQILRYRHGSVIDQVTDTQIERILVPCPSRKDQISIGDKIRRAYEKRAEAIHFEGRGASGSDERTQQGSRNQGGVACSWSLARCTTLKWRQLFTSNCATSSWAWNRITANASSFCRSRSCA